MNHVLYPVAMMKKWVNFLFTFTDKIDKIIIDFMQILMRII